MSVARLRVRTQGSYNSKSPFITSSNDYYNGADVEYNDKPYTIYNVNYLDGGYTYNIISKEHYIEWVQSGLTLTNFFLTREERKEDVILGLFPDDLTPVDYINKYMCKSHSCFTNKNNKPTSIYAKSSINKQKYNKQFASVFMMNKQFLTLKYNCNYNKPWHQSSDKSTLSIDLNKGIGVDIKHNSYQRRLMKLKAKNSAFCL